MTQVQPWYPPAAADHVAVPDQTLWAVQCHECGRVGTGRTRMLAMLDGAIFLHARAWPDGSNPRLCRDCRRARKCSCQRCKDERRS